MGVGNYCKRMLGVILGIDICVIVVAVVLGQTQRWTTSQFFAENGFVTYFSSLQLLVLAWLGWKTLQLRSVQSNSRVWEPPVLVWLIISAFSLYLFMDEFFRLHENIDLIIHRFLGLEESALSDRIDDLLVCSYGLLALLGSYLFSGELKRYARTFPFFAAGFVLFFLMIILDILTNRNDVLQIIFTDRLLANKLYHRLGLIEDMLKLFSEGLFLGAFYYCFEIARSLVKTDFN